MILNEIVNGDCIDFLNNEEVEFDAVITSPFYNTNKKAGKGSTLTNTDVKEGQYNYVRYDEFVDVMTNEDYIDFTVKLFKLIDKRLRKNGVVLYNMSYGSENTEAMFLAISGIIENTNFTVADMIVWKKRSAMPNSSSPNKLTRIVEYIFVIVRKDEFKSFKSSKKVSSVRKTGQRMYENIFNFIEAPNNDGPCPYNKATYSSDLVEKLIDIYINEGDIVYDPFMGSGTTAVACIKKGINYIGTELSEKQCDWARERIDKLLKEGVK